MGQYCVGQLSMHCHMLTSALPCPCVLIMLNNVLKVMWPEAYLGGFDPSTSLRTSKVRCWDYTTQHNEPMPCTPSFASRYFIVLLVTNSSMIHCVVVVNKPPVQAKTCWKRTKCCWAAQIRSRLESSVSNWWYRQLWRGIQHLESSVSNWRGETLDSTGYVRFWVNKCKQQVKETSQGRI